MQLPDSCRGSRALSWDAVDAPAFERRSGYDRRRLTLMSFVRGGLSPRRRAGRRRGENDRLVDWHEPHLLFLALSILLLSVTDAFFTLTLLMHGAQEVNPLMAYLLGEHPKAFAAVKMTLTGAGIVVLVALARATVFRLIRVSSIIHGFLVAYVLLVAYEVWLLRNAL